MEYSSKLNELINSNNANNIMNWVAQQPLIEQPDILREFKEIVAAKFKDFSESNNANLLEEFNEKIEDYENGILDEQMASLKYEIAKDDLDNSIKDMFDTAAQMRTYVIKCITTNAPNAAQMKKLAQQIIHFEKEAGTYNNINWEAIL